MTALLFAGLTLFAHIVVVAAVVLIVFGIMNTCRLTPDIAYLFWPTFLAGTIIWAMTSYKFWETTVELKYWYNDSINHYLIAIVVGMVAGIAFQRKRL